MSDGSNGYVCQERGQGKEPNRKALPDHPLPSLNQSPPAVKKTHTYCLQEPLSLPLQQLWEAEIFWMGVSSGS